MHLVNALELVKQEVLKASAKHKPMNGHHEAYAVIAEEFNKEYWEEVCKGGGTPRDLRGLRVELTHTAAMAIRALVDLCDIED